MNLEVKNGLLVSEYGIRLLELRPDFIDAIWRNPSCRGAGTSASGKSFTRIRDGDVIYMEKTEQSQGLNNLKKHASMEDWLKEEEFKHIRIARPYFADVNNFLMEHVPNATAVENSWSLIRSMSHGAKDEYWRFLRIGMSHGVGVDETGEVVIIDPHCGIDQKYDRFTI